jgi:hypothetical protein
MVLIILGVIAVVAGVGVGGYFLYQNFADDLGGSWPEPAAFQGPARVPRFTLEQTVTVRVAGITDRDVMDAVSEGLGSIVDPGQGKTTTSNVQGDRATFTVAPVSDPDAFAKKITCGTVKKVRGRTITMVANARPEQRAGASPAPADVIGRAIADLKAPEPHRRIEALMRLKDMKPTPERSQGVVTALEAFLSTANFGERRFAEEAIAVWATSENVPLLIQLLDDRGKDSLGHQPIIEALRRLKDERAIEPLAERLGNFFDRKEAGEALKAFGPAAEKAVLKQIHHSDSQVQMIVCEILAAIGTAESLPILEAVAAGRDQLVVPKARDAIRVIKARNKG